MQKRYELLTLPCVVPLFTSIHSHMVPLYTTFCLRQDRKLIYQFTKYGHIGQTYIFQPKDSALHCQRL